MWKCSVVLNTILVTVIAWDNKQRWEPGVSITPNHNITYNTNETITITCTAQHVKHIEKNYLDLALYSQKEIITFPQKENKNEKSDTLITSRSFDESWNGIDLFCKIRYKERNGNEKFRSSNEIRLILDKNKENIEHNRQIHEAVADGPSETTISSPSIFVIIGYVVGSMLLLAILAFVCYFLLCRKRKIVENPTKNRSEVAVHYAKFDLPESSNRFLHEKLTYATIIGQLKPRTNSNL